LNRSNARTVGGLEIRDIPTPHREKSALQWRADILAVADFQAAEPKDQI